MVFPIHPRTRKMLGGAGGRAALPLIDPVGYLDFLSLEADAAAVLTDSGGIQEETTYLGVPCFTLRDNTERPVTIRAGTNTLLGLDPGADRGDPGPARARRGSAPRRGTTGPPDVGRPCGRAGRRSPRGLGSVAPCRCPRWFRATASSSTSSTRRARTPSAPLGCSRRCSRTGPTSGEPRPGDPARRAGGRQDHPRHHPARQHDLRHADRRRGHLRARDPARRHRRLHRGDRRLHGPLPDRGADGAVAGDGRRAGRVVRAARRRRSSTCAASRIWRSTGSRSTGSRTTATGSTATRSRRCSRTGSTRCS